MVEHFIGSYPEQTPAILSAEVTASKTHEDGSVRRRIRVILDTPKRVAFEMALWVPQGDGPFPLLLTAPRFYQRYWAEDARLRVTINGTAIFDGAAGAVDGVVGEV